MPTLPPAVRVARPAPDAPSVTAAAHRGAHRSTSASGGSVYRPFPVAVVRSERLSPSFQRVTLAGRSLVDFAGEGYDQRINLVLPLAGTGLDGFPQGPDWYQTWRALPATRRHPVRTYTVRAHRADRCEVDIDFVLHGGGPGGDSHEGGPASRWAAGARPGDPLLLVGPDVRRAGPATAVTWAPPPDAHRLLLAGDETAVPALSAILEALPPGVAATVLLEVPYSGDALNLRVPAGVEVVWLSRAGAGRVAAHGELLVPAAREAASNLGASSARAVSLPEVDVDTEHLWEVPGPVEPGPQASAAGHPGCYAWFAGEAGAVRLLRRHLVTGLGVDRRSVAFMGYWRLGRAVLN